MPPDPQIHLPPRVVNEGRKSGRCWDEAIRGPRGCLGPMPPLYPSSAPRPAVGSPTNVWSGPRRGKLLVIMDCSAAAGLPVNESLIGFRHEESPGINIGCGLKVTKGRKLQNKTSTITTRFHSLYHCLQDAGGENREDWITQEDGSSRLTQIDLHSQKC